MLNTTTVVVHDPILQRSVLLLTMKTKLSHVAGILGKFFDQARRSYPGRAVSSELPENVLLLVAQFVISSRCFLCEESEGCQLLHEPWLTMCHGCNDIVGRSNDVYGAATLSWAVSQDRMSVSPVKSPVASSAASPAHWADAGEEGAHEIEEGAQEGEDDHSEAPRTRRQDEAERSIRVVSRIAERTRQDDVESIRLASPIIMEVEDAPHAQEEESVRLASPIIMEVEDAPHAQEEESGGEDAEEESDEEWALQHALAEIGFYHSNEFGFVRLPPAVLPHGHAPARPSSSSDCATLLSKVDEEFIQQILKKLDKSDFKAIIKKLDTSTIRFLKRTWLEAIRIAQIRRNMA